MSRFIHATFVLLVIISGTSYVGEVYAQDGTDIQIENPMEMISGEYEIQEVSVSGISPDRESYLINQSGLTVGSVVRIPGEAVPDAIHRLYQTGLYSDVEIRTEQVAGGLHVEIIVQEQPRLERYILEGIKRSDRRDLRDRLNLISGFAVKNSDRAQAVNTIRRYFREEGYWNTTVEIEEERTDDLRNRVTLTFNIDPGERIKVRRIQFIGNENFRERKLKRQLDTIKEDTWWRIFKKHVFTREDFEEAKQNLIDFYRENGHRDVRVVRDSVYTYDFRRGKQGVSIDMEIHEGPQYKVRNIEWDGNSVYSDERLTQALGFQKGEVFNERKFRENLEMSREEGDVTSLYHNIGYLFFQVYEDIRVVAEDSLDLQFDIIENDIATIEDVSFSGNDKTHDDVVRRVLRTVPGQTYSRSAIIRSIRELSTLGYFNPEGIEPNLNPNPEAKTVGINYQLDESQSTDNFEFSGGFGGRQIGVILAARVNFNNFSVQRMFEPGGWKPIPSGDGQKLSLGVQVTGRGYQSYSFSFQEPWLGGKPTSFGVSMSYDILNFGRFSTRSTGERNELFSSSVSIGRQLKWPDDYFSQSTSVRYQLYNIAGNDGIFGDGKTNIISLRHKIERNSLDNFISPTRGSQMHITGEVAPPLPNFGQYFKIKSGYHHHNTLVGRLVLSASADYGYMGYFGSGTRSNFQRFFLGGTAIQQRQSFINDNIDMRGFPGGSTGVISPVDENRNLIGGRVYSKYTMELRYPAVTSEQVQLIPYIFMDAGNTYLDLDSFDPFNLKRAAGVGARIYLPILGLVDLSYGYRMDGTPASVRGNGLQAGEWEFLFNMGAPF
ncbi:MAG: outer membrane protein assembly factor BamA [Balneolaceae bacterium]